MVSIGLYSETPNIPIFDGRDQFKGEVIHVSALKSRDQLNAKRVVVVGYGKSATDAAVESAAVATKTDIVFRQTHWPVPRNLLGILPFKWGMLNRLTSTLDPDVPTPDVSGALGPHIGQAFSLVLVAFGGTAPAVPMPVGFEVWYAR